MTRTTKRLLGTAIGAAALALSAASASADSIACSGDTCWHVKDRYTYPAESKVIIQEEKWKPGPAIKFQEHEGRGYWRSGVWVGF